MTNKINLIKLIPDFGDDEKRNSLMFEIDSFAKKLGFTQPELMQLNDNRFVIMAYLAMVGSGFNGKDPKMAQLLYADIISSINTKHE